MANIAIIDCHLYKQKLATRAKEESHHDSHFAQAKLIKAAHTTALANENEAVTHNSKWFFGSSAKQMKLTNH
jgi:hypothetical protein